MKLVAQVLWSIKGDGVKCDYTVPISSLGTKNWEKEKSRGYLMEDFGTPSDLEFWKEISLKTFLCKKPKACQR